MGYGRALLMRDVKAEEEAFQKKAKKKSLWGSIGRTIGGLGAMALTGGIVNPWTVGAITTAASFAGGAIGASTLGGGKLTGGKFFQADRESAQKELGAFGTQNIVSSLKSGITAGLMKQHDIMKTRKSGLSYGKKLGKELQVKGEASLGTGTRYQRNPIAKEGWSVDPTYGKTDVRVPRGEFAPGEITKKIEYDEAITGNISPREIRRDIPAMSKVHVPEMKPMWNKQTLKQGLEKFVAPGKVTESIGGEMVTHAGPLLSEGPATKMPDWWENLWKDKKNGMSTVIEGK